MNTLTICIPTYGNYQLLYQCLRSLVYNAPYDYNVIIVNNESSKESQDHISRIVCNGGMEQVVSVVQPGSNLRWMGAINIGLHNIRTMGTQYFCMMNDDVIFPPNSNNFWENLLRHFQDPKVGAVGPCSNFVAGNQSLHLVGMPNTIETSCLIGFCMVLRSKQLREMGGLDEELPGGDDLDVSIRLSQNGYKLIAERGSYLHHIGQQTGKRVFEGYWDSEIHQEKTMNAIIRKHGFTDWYDCWTHQWLPYESKENDEASIHI